jgi:hypothetical protein
LELPEKGLAGGKWREKGYEGWTFWMEVIGFGMHLTPSETAIVLGNKLRI